MTDYGTDLWCVQDLDLGGTEVDGNLVLAQACARRLITPRGGLLDDLNYGYDLTRFLGDDLGTPQLAIMRSGIQAELLKDERVLSANVVAAFSTASGILTVAVGIVGAAGPFQFVLTVSSLAAPLLQVAA